MTDKTPMPVQYWSEPVESLLAVLPSTAGGLTTPEAQQRLATYGANVLETKKKTTALGVFVNQFKSPIILILLFATAVSAVLQDWVDALIILTIVLGSALLSFYRSTMTS